jgi:hypothetical protein
MSRSRVCAAWTAAMLTALSGSALAQQFPPPPAPAPAGPPSDPVQDRWPEPAKPPQAGDAAPVPAKPTKRGAVPVTAPTAAPSGEEPLQAPAPVAHKPAPTPANVVTCGGVFAKDSTHLKIAVKYDSRNITYGQVDGPEGTKIPGSILFPNDPKRRLEVLWANEAARSDPSVIAINGKSQWSAPKGMKLGLPIAALEKANGKPFKLSGFDKDGFTSVAGWDGGALSNLPGGCKIGIRLHADAKAPEQARSAVTGDKELASNEAGVKAVNPTVIEILVGY